MVKMARPRGRPKNSDIEVLITQGSNEFSRIQCPVCNRIFVRHKNLKAHISAHKAEKKYVCDFPLCTRKFVQSSQLSCHKYTHSEEKPFKCPAEGCNLRQRHSNRCCLYHVDLKLIKVPESAVEVRSKFYKNMEHLTEDQKIWFEQYMSERERKQTAPQKKRKSDDMEHLQEISDHQEVVQSLSENPNRSWIDDVAIFSGFMNTLHKKGGNSKALFNAACSSFFVSNLSKASFSPISF